MLRVKNKLKGKLTQKQCLKGKLNIAKEYTYPTLINLEITPSKERQVFNHEGSYGYDIVTVNPMESLSIEVQDNTLIFSEGNIKDGELIL